MKVVHLICSFTTGGSELMLIDIVNEQVNHGLKVFLFVINNCVDQNLLCQLDPKVSIIRINRKPKSRNIFPILKLNLLLLALKADILHSHDEIIAGMLFPIFRNKLCLTVHTLGVSTKYLYCYKKLIAISDSVKEDLLDRAQIDSVLIHNGVNCSIIKKREWHNLSNNTMRIVVVGRLEHEVKGQDILIKALSYFEPLAQHVFVDFIGDGHSKKYLESLAGSYELEKNIRFLGLKNRKSIYELLCNYDLLVQPSICEGFGLTIAEAMLAKVPVLVSGKGPAEIIGNGVYGSLFESGNIEQCGEQLLSILDHYDELEDKVDQAYDYAQAHFSLSEMVLKYEQVYKSILNRTI